MKRNIFGIAIISLIVLCFAGCAQSPTNSRGTIEIKVGNSAGTRSMLPDTVPEVAKYKVSLGEIVDGQVKLDSEKNKTGLIFSGDTETIVINGVMPGTYSVTVDAYDSNDVPIMSGSSTSSLTVSASATNSVDVKLALISEGSYTGSVEAVFDWTSIATTNDTIKNAMENGGLAIQLSYKNQDNEWIAMTKSAVSGKDTTRITYRVDGLPVSTGLVIKYALYAADGILLNSALTTSVAQIYSGLVSVPDINEGDVFYITDNDISDALNVTDVKWEYSSTPNEVVVKWTNQVSRVSGPLFKSVEVVMTTGSSDMTQTISVGSDATSSCKFTLESGSTYTLKLRANHKSGMVSPYYEYPESIVGKVPVQDVAINQASIPENLYSGLKFELSATVLPDNATFKTVDWSSDNSKIISVNGNTLNAVGLGTVNITATSTDDKSKSDTFSVTVKLAAPENVSVAKGANEFTVSWDSVNSAETYEIFRSVDGAEFVSVGTVTELSYADTAIMTGSDYSYKVKAKSSSVSGCDSALSAATETVRMSDNVINIENATIDSTGLKITIKESDSMVLLPGMETLTVSVGEISGVTEYIWYINGEEVKRGSASNGGTFVGIERGSDGIRDDVAYSNNSLMLEVKTSSGIYSATVDFGVVDSLATNVVIDSGNEVTRLSNKTSDGKYRTVQLKAHATGGSLSTVMYESADETKATVTDDGTVTFTDYYGSDVTIYVYPSYNKTAKKAVVYDIYKPLINNSNDVLNIMRPILNDHIDAANTWFSADWWGEDVLGSKRTWNEVKGVTIENCTGSDGFGKYDPENPGVISYVEYSHTANTGESYEINGKINVLAKGEDSSGYLGFDALQYVGCSGSSNNTLTISLPFNQGSVSVTYNNINIISGTGSYTVTFNNPMGYDGISGAQSPINYSSDDIVLTKVE